ncbi:SAC3/GANP/Nin1/mts3/eIF-3 p25 family-domain-containing protein [Myxozyma melibiosi]|uniref:SAC3/GANP/Nin1/mts3/eIF-3 p25 family-domain-containing protein n=1 Tax=Myxozyma melibiosi TaxID=54550 RepID=A0ABR1FEZ1_9ASCO
MSAPPWSRSKFDKPSFGTVNVSKSIKTSATVPKTSNTSSFTPSSSSSSSTSATAAETTSSSRGNGGAAAAAGSNAWPPSLKEYVGRCFTAFPPSQRPMMEVNLKKIISAALDSGAIWTIDWDKQPLPIEPESNDDDMEDRLEALRGNRDKDTAMSDAPLTTEQTTKRKATKRSAKWDQPPSDDYSPPPPSPTIKKKKIDLSTRFVMSEEDKAKKESRARRFHSDSHENTATPTPPPPSFGADQLYISDGVPEVFVGRCQKLEKRYLRLTSAPDPETVRPLPVLKQALELLKQKWREEKNYAYICDQFKSMRQDLTVQLIQNEFTVNVYEIHARIALERGDLGEYNQCQTQLRALYEKGIPGHPEEFLAYRILYFLHTRNQSDMNELLTELTEKEKENEAVMHALAVRTALTDSDYHTLMKLYMNAPNMGGYVMDSFIDRERLLALEIICKAFRPEIGLDYLTVELGFESEEECLEFMQRNSIIEHFDSKTRRLRTKEAYPVVMYNRMAAFKKIDIKGQL